jgi:hypothetical protein
VLSRDERRRFDEIVRRTDHDAPQAGSLVDAIIGAPARLWTWLTTCAADGCSRHPAHLGWCDEHAPAYDPGPDEFWGAPESDHR